jgi:hypothetical protein
MMRGMKIALPAGFVWFLGVALLGSPLARADELVLPAEIFKAMGYHAVVYPTEVRSSAFTEPATSEVRATPTFVYRSLAF